MFALVRVERHVQIGLESNRPCSHECSHYPRLQTLNRLDRAVDRRAAAAQTRRFRRKPLVRGSLERALARCGLARWAAWRIARRWHRSVGTTHRLGDARAAGSSSSNLIGEPHHERARGTAGGRAMCTVHSKCARDEFIKMCTLPLLAARTFPPGTWTKRPLIDGSRWRVRVGAPARALWLADPRDEISASLRETRAAPWLLSSLDAGRRSCGRSVTTRSTSGPTSCSGP